MFFCAHISLVLRFCGESCIIIINASLLTHIFMYIVFLVERTCEHAQRQRQTPNIPVVGESCTPFICCFANAISSWHRIGLPISWPLQVLTYYFNYWPMASYGPVMQDWIVFQWVCGNCNNCCTGFDLGNPWLSGHIDHGSDAIEHYPAHGGHVWPAFGIPWSQ